MVKSRSSKGLLLTPAGNANISDKERESWLSLAINGFVAKGQANRNYYEVILRDLWPEGAGIPGPVRSEQDIREAVNTFRAAHSLEPYKDVFRRLRELQGDEGFTCIVKEGTKYQLQSLQMGPKREPRGKPSKPLWASLLEAADHRCAHCGQQEPSVKLSPDHRRPRSRGGNNEDSNWQPLCEQCNNQKSSACQGCEMNCMTCPWAYPEDYKPIVIDDQNREQIRRGAEKAKRSASEFANDALRNYFNSLRR
jgi:5-methylcytosine-specific restriction endonuclease McrA